MRIECERCKTIYGEYDDTVVEFKQYNIGESEKTHLCPVCSAVLKDFIYENIPLKKKGQHQLRMESDAKVANDYYEVLRVLQ